MNRRTLFRLALPAVALAGLAGALVLSRSAVPDERTSPPASTPPTAPPGSGARQVVGTGLVEPSSELIEAAPGVSGVIARVYVVAGDAVAVGAPLVSLDARTARDDERARAAALETARADRRAAEVALADARAQLGFYESVGDPRAIAREELSTRRFAVERAERDVATRRAQERESRAALEQARTLVEQHTVRAPVAATVLQVGARPGEYAVAGPQASALVSLGRVDPLHVRVNVDEMEAARVKPGGPAWVSPRGAASVRVPARFVRAEPLVIPKPTLTGTTEERVDTRVAQYLYAVEPTPGLFVGQQVDVFMAASWPARP